MQAAYVLMDREATLDKVEALLSESSVRGADLGSTLETYATPFGRIGGLICWENYMPLVRFYLYAQGVDVWVAPTLARGDAWVATMQHIAREGRCDVIGVNPACGSTRSRPDFPDREKVWRTDPDDPEWVEPGNTVIVGPNAAIIAGPSRHEETVLVAELDLDAVGQGDGCSTRSATTTVPTSSGSPSTPHRGPWSPPCAATSPTTDPYEGPPQRWRAR